MDYLNDIDLVIYIYIFFFFLFFLCFHVDGSSKLSLRASWKFFTIFLCKF